MGAYLKALYLSVFQTRGFDAVKFVGLKNFIDIAKDGLFWVAVKNTFLYVFWGTLLCFFPPIIAAVCLNEITRAKAFFRVSVYLPCVIPGVAISLLWNMLYDPSSSGMFNSVLNVMGFENFGWLQDKKWTIFLICLKSSWSFGGNAIIFLADLQSVNGELYEAAELDGASVWRKVWNITLPHMRNIILTMTLLGIMGRFQTFMDPYVMTGGGPGNASVTVNMLSYKYAFEYFQMDKAVVTGIYVSALILISTILYKKLEKKLEDDE